MNLLLLDQTQSMLAFALRCMRAGHYVRLCLAIDKETKRPSLVGDGLVEKIKGENWKPHMNWADLVVTSDNVKWLRELDIYRKKGYPVFGPSYEAAELELSRAKGQALLKKNGVKVIDYESFSDYGKAEKYVTETMGTYVAKPDGDKDKALSYVSKSPADMVFMLRRWAEMSKGQGGKFMLQEFVPGVEFAVAGWLGPKGFSRYVEENFEHKKLMNDDYGPNTGEMGTVCKYTDESALAKEVLFPLERDLVSMGCTGSVDVSVIVDENGDPRPLEFTCRLGWPSFNIVQALHPEPCEWMVDLLDGNDTFQPSLDHATGVVMAIPKFPYGKEDEKEVCGIPIYNLNDENEHFEHLCPSDIMAGEAPTMLDDALHDERCMVSCGNYLVVATGAGESVREATLEAYKAVESLEIPNDVMVRTDIGSRLKRDIPKLQDYGFAQDWVY